MDAILTEPSVEQLRIAIEDNLVAHFNEFAVLPRAHRCTDPELSWVVTGAAHPMLNGVWRSRLFPDTADARIADTMRVFEKVRVPMRWVVSPSAEPADLGERLVRHGLSHDDDWIGMAIDLHKLEDAPEPADELAIEEVVDRDSLRKWLQVFRQSSAAPEDVGLTFCDLFSRLGLGSSRNVRHWIASLAGVPVARTTLVLASGVAGIHWVATVPQARRRGAAAALVLSALREARAIGYRYAVLHSSQMGASLYRGLGFEDCSIHEVYVWRPQE